MSLRRQVIIVFTSAILLPILIVGGACGLDSKGLPVGIQMIGDCFMEKKILRAAHAYEKRRGSFAVPGEGGSRK